MNERERENVLWLVFSSLLQAAWPLFGPLSSRSLDPVDRADRTTSGSPAAICEWRSGALGGALCAEMVVAQARLHLIFLYLSNYNIHNVRYQRRS